MPITHNKRPSVACLARLEASHRRRGRAAPGAISIVFPPCAWRPSLNASPPPSRGCASCVQGSHPRLLDIVQLYRVACPPFARTIETPISCARLPRLRQRCCCSRHLRLHGHDHLMCAGNPHRQEHQGLLLMENLPRRSDLDGRRATRAHHIPPCWISRALPISRRPDALELPFILVAHVVS